MGSGPHYRYRWAAIGVVWRCCNAVQPRFDWIAVIALRTIENFLTLVLGAAVVALENKIGDLGAWLARTTGVEWFSTLGESVTIVTGLIFIVCVLAFRRGIMGELIAWLQGRGKS